MIDAASKTLDKLVKKVLMFFFLVKRVPGRGPEHRESDKTVLYLLIVIIILISYIIIKLLIKRRTISAETGKGTLKFDVYRNTFIKKTSSINHGNLRY